MRLVTLGVVGGGSLGAGTSGFSQEDQKIRRLPAVSLERGTQALRVIHFGGCRGRLVALGAVSVGSLGAGTSGFSEEDPKIRRFSAVSLERGTEALRVIHLRGCRGRLVALGAVSVGSLSAGTSRFSQEDQKIRRFPAVSLERGTEALRVIHLRGCRVRLVALGSVNGKATDARRSSSTAAARNPKSPSSALLALLISRSPC